MPTKPNNNCIVYCRVSTAKSAQEGESLDTQAMICRSFAAGRDFSIVPGGLVFRETFSGRADSRPVLADVFDYIRRHPGEVQYFVFRVIDRFTRGGSYSYEKIKKELAELGVEMIDTYGVIQPPKNTLAHVGFEYDWSRTSPSEITEIVMATSAKAEVTNILTRMIGREIELTQQGYKVRSADDGYLNKKVYVEGKRKVIQVLDPDRAQFFIDMFKLRAAGCLTDPQIADRINAMGYRSKHHNRWDASHERILGRVGGVPLTVKRLQLIVQRPIYCGIVCQKWTRGLPVKAAYQGLVDIDTFNRANRGKVFVKSTPTGLELLYNHHPQKITLKRARHNPLFPYRHLILCPSCRKPFYGSAPQGKSGRHFPTYHCSRGHRYLGIPKTQFDATVESFLKRLRFNPSALPSMEAMLRIKYQERKHELAHLARAVNHTVEELKTEQKSKVEAFTAASSPILRSRLEKDVEELEARIKTANQQGPEIPISEQDISQFTTFAKTALEHLPNTLMDSAKPREQQALLSLVFDALPTYEEITSGTPKKAWIFEHLGDSAAPKSSLVNSPGFDWNTIEKTILKWKAVFAGDLGELRKPVEPNPSVDSTGQSGAQ